VPQLGINIPAAALLRFWTMVAHSHGGIWNSADPARSLGIGESTVRRYLDLFTSLLMVRQLQPWHENLNKRQVKAPKVYVRDSGLLHALLGIRTEGELLAHPKRGASWEGYAVEEILKVIEPDETYFWATHQGAELDLLLFKGGRRFGIEIKADGCAHADTLDAYCASGSGGHILGAPLDGNERPGVTARRHHRVHQEPSHAPVSIHVRMYVNEDEVAEDDSDGGFDLCC
jgi:Domain of unknown function (DUF4143)